MYHPEGPTFLELMKQALVSTERGYDLLAPKFDYTPFRTPDPILDALARVVGGERSIASALDVCCGTGAAMQKLRPLCRDRVVGFDFSAGMIAEARTRVAAAGGDAAFDFVQGDALSLPFHEEFDVVTSVGAFGHILPADEDRFIAGITRALRPGGRFVFATSEKPNVASAWFWAAHGFNAVMRVRNAVLRPEFIMYYLTFTWPDVRAKLERHNLDVTVHRTCPKPYDRAVIVEARLRGS